LPCSGERWLKMSDDSAIFFRILTRDVNFVNQIFEGYEYLGVVSTVDRARGILVVRATPDTASEAREVLENLPIELEFIDKL
jgi:hypothetical protein